MSYFTVQLNNPFEVVKICCISLLFIVSDIKTIVGWTKGNTSANSSLVIHSFKKYNDRPGLQVIHKGVFSYCCLFTFL